MIAFDNDTKNAYKDYNREIKVCGNLYLANKRVSKNLFNPFNDVITVASVTYDIKSNSIKVNPSDPTLYYNYVGIKLNTEDVLGKTLYISSDFETTTMSSSLRLYSYKNQRVITQYGSKIVEDKSNGKIKFQATIPDTLPSDVDGFTLLIYSNANYQASTDKYSTYKNIMIYTEDCSYEPYGQYINDYNVINTTSKNLLDDGLYTDISNLTYSNNEFTQIQDYANTDYTFRIKGLYNNQTIWEKSINLDYGIKHAYFLYQNDIDTIEMGFYSQTTNTIVRYDVPSNLTNNTNYCISMMFTNVTSGKVSFENLQINSGMTPLPYERYNSSPFRFNEENECEILGFNIQENTDIYYESLPYNTMSIVVNNEKGYFTYEDNDSILDYLNENCYVELFMSINDGNYYKIMTMNYKKIRSSDYEKAELDFISSIAYLKDLEYRDINKDFKLSSISSSTFKQYMRNNYDIGITIDTIEGWPNWVSASFNKLDNVKNMILAGGCNTSGGSLYVINNNYKNDITFKNVKKSYIETILQNYQIDKPTINKGGIYQGVLMKSWLIQQEYYTNTTEDFSFEIVGKLNSKRDVRVYADYNYGLRLSITDADLTITGNVNVNTINPYAYSLIEFEITGEIGTEYTITCQRNKIYKILKHKEVGARYGNTDNKANVMNINESSSLTSLHYRDLFVNHTIKSNVSINIMGLPYLEIGDVIQVELDNGNKTIAITDIEIEFKDGLIETIKGYEII